MIQNDQATMLRMMAVALKRQNDEYANSEEQKPISKTIAITSGKGGVGKTNIAANLALAMSIQKAKVGIIDADLGLANIDVILRLKPKYNLEHVVSGEKKISEIFVKGPAGLTIIPASPGRIPMASLSEFDRSMLIRELIRSANNFDFTFIDTAAGISNNVVDFAVSAQQIIVVTTPEPTAITDAYAMIKVISQRKDADLSIIVNMAQSPEQAMEVGERIILAGKKFINAKANFLGYILMDKAVSDSVSSQEPLIFKYPEAIATKCINSLANRILEKDL
jgi:flagellar biosynthesis protein FlhG